MLYAPSDAVTRERSPASRKKLIFTTCASIRRFVVADPSDPIFPFLIIHERSPEKLLVLFIKKDDEQQSSAVHNERELSIHWWGKTLDEHFTSKLSSIANVERSGLGYDEKDREIGR